MPSDDAIVVGAGPNGLAAAIRLARAGLRVRLIEARATPGGAARSAQVTLPGFVHDLGSAIHPMAAASPFFRSIGLEKYGLHWVQPDIPLVHPLPSPAPAAALHRDLPRTASGLGRDSLRYRLLFGPLAAHYPELSSEILGPILHSPHHPFLLARFGLRALPAAQSIIRHWFRTEPARALFAGLAAHSFLPLSALSSSAIGVVLGMMGHVAGWPFPRGGAQSIVDALVKCFLDSGGHIECHAPLRSLADLPPARAILLDLTPWQFLQLAGDRLPFRYRHALRRFRHASAIFKLDYALAAPVPWLDPAARRAGTLHLCGTAAEVIAAEHDVSHGRIPDNPFVLVAQHSLFDSTRAPAGQHTLWAYCHIPFGSIFDMTSRIESQIERFAPGFLDRVLARHTMGPVELEAWNPNLIGGDISGGSNSLRQILARPVFSTNPYRTPLPGVYLCSSSTPPGGGVHGMCGYNAASAALKDLFS